MPPLPVPPVERRALPPFLARITITGDTKLSGTFETCMDFASARISARARAQARPAEPPVPPGACTNTNRMLAGGAIHHETICDQAKGARASFHITTDGTPSDLRTHTELKRFDASTGASKTMVYDSHLVRLGACPADLKPGQMRRPGGQIIDPARGREILNPGRAGETE